MSFSMDDLLKKNDEVARRQQEYERQREEGKARSAAYKNRGVLAIQHVLDRVKAVVKEFNDRSTAGQISYWDGNKGDWFFELPNGGSRMTLSSHIDPAVKKIKDKVCGIMATLSNTRGYGVHFLLLEDENTADKNEWMAVRVTNNPVSRFKQFPVEPFITSLDEIAKGASSMHSIVPQFSSDLDAAIREMIGYGYST